MKNKVPDFVKGFFLYAHELGALYYAYALLSALTTGAFWVYKALSAPMSGAIEWSFWLFVGAAFMTALVAPVLGFALFKRLFPKKNEQVANPNLIIRKREVSYVVRKGHLLKNQTLVLEAIDSASCFKFLVSVTGTSTLHVALKCYGSTLRGPVARGAGDSYEIHFPNTLLKGETITISFDIEVDDPNQTMRTFLSDRFHNAAGYGEFSAKYTFHQLPVRITKERSTVAGEALETTDLLHRKTNDGLFVYDFSITKVDAHCVYTVSWVW